MFSFLKKRRIRWLLATIAVILLGGGAIYYWYSRASLADFVGINLRTLDDTHPTAFGEFLGGILPEQFPGPRTKLNQVLKKILPEAYTRLSPYRPWYIWCLDDSRCPRFIILEVESSLKDVTSMLVHFLDSKGQYLETFEFRTGHENQILDAAIEEKQLGVPLIKIITSAPVLGPSTGRQYYGISKGGGVTLLRIEDQQEQLVPNSYVETGRQVGPPPVSRSRQRWERLLFSSDSTHILEGLVWVGGRHRSDGLWRPMYAETLEDIRLVADLRNSKAVQDRIAELAVSENQWIREAAVLAQEQLPKKGGC